MTALLTGSAATASRMRGEGVAVVRRGAGPQAHLDAVLPRNDAIAVELDFVQPAGTGRWSVGQRGLARQDKAGQAWNGTGSGGKLAKAYATKRAERQC